MPDTCCKDPKLVFDGISPNGDGTIDLFVHCEACDTKTTFERCYPTAFRSHDFEQHSAIEDVVELCCELDPQLVIDKKTRFSVEIDGDKATLRAGVQVSTRSRKT